MNKKDYLNISDHEKEELEDFEKRLIKKQRFTTPSLEDVEHNHEKMKEQLLCNYLPTKNGSLPEKAIGNQGISLNNYDIEESEYVPVRILGKMPIPANLLEVNQENPLYNRLNFQSVLGLERYIEAHAEHLENVQEFIHMDQLENLIKSYSNQTFEDQLSAINEDIAGLTKQIGSKEIQGREVKIDKIFKRILLEKRNEIKTSLESKGLLINEFVKDLDLRNYSKETVAIFLRNHEKFKAYGNKSKVFRKAQKESSVLQEKEYENIAHTLNGWITKWEEFRKSRTGQS